MTLEQARQLQHEISQTNPEYQTQVRKADADQWILVVKDQRSNELIFQTRAEWISYLSTL